MLTGLVSAAYIVAGALFIQSLGGLSHPETARRGNAFGILGMSLAVIATAVAVPLGGWALLAPALLVGGVVGAVLAARVAMTNMPQLVAILHSFVGLAAVFVGLASFFGGSHAEGAERIVHAVELYIGEIGRAHV